MSCERRINTMWRRKNTAVAQMTRAYVKLFALLYVATTLVVISTVSYQLIQSRTADAQRIVTSLRGADIDSDFDWETWRRNSTIDTRDTFVVIKSQHETYYSTGSATFLKRIADRHLWLDHFYKARERYFYYYQTGHLGKMTYQIYIGLYEVIAMVETVSTALLVTLTVIFILTIFVIRQLAKDLNAPLLTLTQAVKTLDYSGTQDLVLPNIEGAEEIETLNRYLQSWLKQLQTQLAKERAFISNASHELKTPLAGFRGNIDLIKRRGTDHPEIIPTAIANLDQESRRMQNLVATLLALSKTANQPVMNQETVQVVPILERVIHAFEIDTQRVVERQFEDFSVTVNVDEFSQLIRIILDNAAKYSPESTVITVLCGPKQIQMIDQGSGIADHDKPHIFEQFYRGDKSHSDISGSGLGLALAKQLADRQHVQITLLDHHPTGTIVRLDCR